MTAREWHCQNPACDEHGMQTTSGRLRKWCSDRCRRTTLYGGTCKYCGTITNGSDGPGAAPDVCISCAAGHYATWTREAIIACIQQWADESGGIPPATTDFVRGRADDLPVPSVTHVQRMFGSWNAAIIAAGFEPHAMGPVGGCTRLTPQQQRECARRYAAGESSPRIAASLGCPPNTVIKWARAAGVEIRPPFNRTRAA